MTFESKLVCGLEHLERRTVHSSALCSGEVRRGTRRRAEEERTKARTEYGDEKRERERKGKEGGESEREREEEVRATLAAAFSGEPLNRVVFAKESWDHPK